MNWTREREYLGWNTTSRRCHDGLIVGPQGHDVKRKEKDEINDFLPNMVDGEETQLNHISEGTPREDGGDEQDWNPFENTDT